MFKIPAEQARKFLNETDKYLALSNLCDYLEDTCTKDERLETVCIRKAVDAALALKYAMENDKEGIATTYFSNQFTALWEFIVQYCESCSTIKWVVEITEVSQRRETINAYSKEDALTMARDMYNSEIIVLNATNHVETKFEITEE
jgi:hypothetical protein